jgi:hypothetical protein
MSSKVPSNFLQKKNHTQGKKQKITCQQQTYIERKKCQIFFLGGHKLENFIYLQVEQS